MKTGRGSALLLAAVVTMVAGDRYPRLGATSPDALTLQEQAQDISPEAMAQIAALLQEKMSRTPTERKMDSQLIYQLKMSRGQAVAAGVETVATDLPYTDDARVILDVSGEIGDPLLDALRGLGAEIQSVDAARSSVRVAVDLGAIEPIAALASVRFVQPKQEATTSRIGPTPTLAERQAARRLQQGSRLAAFLSAGAPQAPAESAAGTGVGSVSSEGDVAHRAFAARGAFGVNGAGLKIGVLSDGVRTLAASQASGDLGPVTIIGPPAPCPVANTCDEGTAMLEIIHDLAPGAQLYFASAFVSITSFADNIRALRAAGCDVIVDDVGYFVESPFQDGQATPAQTNGGVVTQAVNDVTADGALYFSSAGNSGNLNDGTAGVWEGDFVDGGTAPAIINNIEGAVVRLHSFGAQNFNSLTAINTAAPVSLFWSDPLGGSANDYDLFRLNAAGTTVIGASANIQNGTQDPIEQVNQAANSPRIVIVKFSGAARFLHLNANRGRFSIVTAGQTQGHPSAAAAYAVAATPAGAAFPGGFTSANVVETFSSDGPRRLFFNGAGVPFTPGNLAATGGVLRQKPDITAADGVSVTGVGGFGSPFSGTSAAAPHAAAIAALVKAANPGATPAQIRGFLASSAIDIEAAGVDRDSGAGIVMPVAALSASGAPGTAFFAVTSAVATEHPGNGNGVINAGEGASLAIALQNLGVQNATGVSATLITGTPGIIVNAPNSSPYPNLPALTGTGSNAAPLLFTLGGSIPCPLIIDFSFTVNYAGGSQTLAVPIAAGPSGLSFSSTLDTIAPASSLGVAGSTGVQTGRLTRNGIVSACAPPKAFPGINDAGLRQFDAYAITTCQEATPTCATVNFSAANGLNMFSAAYAPTFVPGSISTNYAGDPGASAATRTYSFPVAGNGQPFAITVHDVPVLATPSNSPYTLSVSNVCAGACATPNHVPVAKAKDVTVSATSACSADASIDDGSSDEDGDTLTITQSPPGPYGIGTTEVRLTVSDKFGAMSQATAKVTVVDTTGPSVTGVSAVVRPRRNGQDLLDVDVLYQAADSCSPGGGCVLSVTPAPTSRGGDDGPDFVIVDAHRVRVRADNSGSGNAGRAYLITITCTDGAGNATVRSVTVFASKSK